MPDTVKYFKFRTYLKLLNAWKEEQRHFLENEYRKSRLSESLKVSANDLYSSVHQEAKPVFVLSTGRSGTKLLTNIFETVSDVRVFHQPSPELTYHSGYAFNNYLADPEKLKAIIDVARYEQIRDSFILGERYVETNNRITFFAYQLAALYPGARFIHLVRDPYKYVESGYSRNWYSGDKVMDEGRAVPGPESGIPWGEYDQVQKISWLWLATNRFISTFSDSHKNRVFLLRSEDLYTSPEKIREMYTFLDLPGIHEEKTRKLIRRPVNRQPDRTRKRLDEKQKGLIREMLESDGYRIEAYL